MTAPKIHLVFDAPPGPEGGRFIEAEDENGKSINVGEWVLRSDGRTALVIDRLRTEAEPATSPRIKPEIIDTLREWAEVERDSGDAERGAAIDAMLDWHDRYRAVRTEADVRVRALEWRTPTDHPGDPDPDDVVFCVEGIGGLYAISRKQQVGPERLLWWAHDSMDWTGFDTIAEAKAAAQADYEKRILSALSEASKVSGAEPLPEAFITAQSGDGKHAVHIKCQTMSDMHRWHDAVLDRLRTEAGVTGVRVTDEMVSRALRCSDLHGWSGDRAVGRGTMRLILEAALQGGDNE